MEAAAAVASAGVVAAAAGDRLLHHLPATPPRRPHDRPRKEFLGDAVRRSTLPVVWRRVRYGKYVFGKNHSSSTEISKLRRCRSTSFYCTIPETLELRIMSEDSELLHRLERLERKLDQLLDQPRPVSATIAHEQQAKTKLSSLWDKLSTKPAQNGSLAARAREIETKFVIKLQASVRRRIEQKAYQAWKEQQQMSATGLKCVEVQRVRPSTRQVSMRQMESTRQVSMRRMHTHRLSLSPEDLEGLRTERYSWGMSESDPKRLLRQVGSIAAIAKHKRNTIIKVLVRGNSRWNEKEDEAEMEEAGRRPFATLMPWDPVTTAWDLMTVLLVVLLAVELPLRLAFGLEAAHDGLASFFRVYDILVDAFFVIDLFKNLLVQSYYDSRSALVTERKKIAIQCAIG